MRSKEWEQGMGGYPVVNTASQSVSQSSSTLHYTFLLLDSEYYVQFIQSIKNKKHEKGSQNCTGLDFLQEYYNTEFHNQSYILYTVYKRFRVL